MVLLPWGCFTGFVLNATSISIVLFFVQQTSFQKQRSKDSNLVWMRLVRISAI
jgi:hypothetical protein